MADLDGINEGVAYPLTPKGLYKWNYLKHLAGELALGYQQQR